MHLRFLAVTTAMLAASIPAVANSIKFDSVSNGVYSYGLFVERFQRFDPGDTVVFSRLYGVTAASSSYSEFVVSFTSDMVVFTETMPSNFSANNDEFHDIFSIISTAGDTGIAAYSLTASSSASGAVNGPLAPPVTTTPEPSGLVLLGTGVLGVISAARRRTAWTKLQQ